MSAEEEQELYLLRKHFGIGAHDALNVIPAWELDLLLAGLEEDERMQQDTETGF